MVVRYYEINERRHFVTMGRFYIENHVMLYAPRVKAHPYIELHEYKDFYNPHKL